MSTNACGNSPRKETLMNKKLVQRYYAAWNTLNTDDPAQFYAKDASLVFFDVVPLKYRGWAEYKKGVDKAFFGKISAGKLTPNNDLKITRRGNVAWMTLTVIYVDDRQGDG